MIPTNPRLKRTRLAAGMLLALMAGLYVFSRSYQHQWPWLEWLRAFSEAGMVGGLADWFAVTALFRHPLGLPIPHTAVIPREKDRIGRALAQFVRGNFLTADRICKQARDLQIIQRLAKWLSQPEKAHQLAGRLVSTVPTAMDALEKHDAHHRVSDKLIEQLRTLDPAELITKLLGWLLDDQRDRQVLAPLLAQIAQALEANKDKIEAAAGDKAPLKKVPLLGRLSRAIAEDFSERTTGSIEAKLIEASQNPDEPLWDLIEQQLSVAKAQLETNPDLTHQLATIRDEWLDDPNSTQLGSRLWQQIRASLEKDLNTPEPKTTAHMASAIAAIGQTIDTDPEMSQNIETILLDALGQILDKHGYQLEIMIRETIEEWDADTLMGKLEQQVGPDLQFIRINGTLIGGLVGITLHAIGLFIWAS